MEYKNPYFYNRDSSIDPQYKYIDYIDIMPMYGSSVSYNSRINILQTYDNKLKIVPSSANSLEIKYNLKFLLDNAQTGNLLKTIEVAGGFKYLKFNLPRFLKECPKYFLII